MLFQVDDMGGLLSQDAQSGINNQSLMNFGLNMLANSGYSATPRSFGEIVGQSGMQALQQRQSLTDRAIEQALRGRQLAKDQAEENRMKRAREAASATIPANLRDAFAADPETAINAAKLAEAAAGPKPDLQFVKDFKLPDGSTVSGYTSPQTGFIPITQPVAPDPTENENKQVLALRTANDTLKDLRKTFDSTGTEYFPTGGKTKLQSQYTNLQLQLKELFNLGVLNGPDLDLMNKIMVDPTSFGSQTFGGTSRAKAGMDEVERFLQNKEKALLQSPGVRARNGNSIFNQPQSDGLYHASDDDLMSLF